MPASRQAVLGGAHTPDMPHAGQEARMTADREVGAT
jgi:hypothetical protein